MNEAQTRAELITPALIAAGWGVAEDSKILHEHSITPGRLEGNGQRGKALKADYALVFRNCKLAVIEAKAIDRPLTEGVAQAKNYADKLAIRFAYATNGKGIYAIDMHTGVEKEILCFPSPEALWEMTFAISNIWRNRFAKVSVADKSGSWNIRYYQELAVNGVLNQIIRNQERILLTLATGAGKTSIAFQIAWKLFQAKWNLNDWNNPTAPTRRPRILFLADRNNLANQAYNDFSSFAAFADDAMVRISPEDIRKKGRVPKNASVFFTIFQTFMSGPPKDGKPSPYFGEYPEDFFDFIVVDECHRGGANDESSWRDILEYFSPAVQLGLTATPKRKDNIDTYAYFGEPVFTYSLKDGINDGFLTPFKVIQISTTLDDYIYTPDDTLIEGEVVRGKRYEEKDFYRVIQIREREAHRVKLFMDQINQAEKTLVFCVSQEHALHVRDLINQMKDSTDPNYCQRVTADDGALGDQHLKAFQDSEKSIPTILTTSQKLSTGVDARNIRNIVLMRPVNSMIEFKQIIGRGTRLFDGKDFFVIYDFVKAHHHFSDREWDGEPIDPEFDGKIYKSPLLAPATAMRANESITSKPNMIKIKLADGKVRSIQHMKQTMFWHSDGTPMSSQQFMELLFSKLPTYFESESELRQIWASPNTRENLLQRLTEADFGNDKLTALQEFIGAEQADLFDVLAYVAFAKLPVSRQDRASLAKARLQSRFNTNQCEFIDFVLQHYVTMGVEELDQNKLSALLRLKYQDSITDAIQDLGDPSEISALFSEFQSFLYLEL